MRRAISGIHDLIRRLSADAAAGRLAAAALLLAALMLRLPGENGYANYFAPELDRDLAVEMKMAAGQWPLVGPPQFQDGRFHFGPAYYYLMYPLARLADFRPWSLALTSLFFSLATVVLGYWMCRRRFKDKALAGLFGVIAVFSALDMQFAKYASNPNLTPFFAVLFFASLEPFLRGAGRTVHAALLGAALAVAAQLHPVAGLGLAAALAAALAAKEFRPDGRGWLAFSVAFALLNLPYLSYELTHGFENFRGLFSLAAGTNAYGGLGSRILEIAAFWFSLWFNVHHMFSAVFLAGMRALFWLYANLAALAFAAWLTRRRASAASNPRMAPHLKFLLAVWLIAPTLVLLLPLGRVNQLPIYYFTSLLPLGHLLLALGVRRLWTAGWRLLAALILASYLGWQIWQIGLYHQLYPSLLTAGLI